MKLRVAAGSALCACVTTLALLTVLTPERRAQARAQSELQYGIGEAFSTAVRFVRIDRGCKVVDKDADAAYVAFECGDGEAKTRKGSLELIKTGAGGVRAQVVLADETHGMELRWLELFERKLRDERGAPVAVPAPAKGKDAAATGGSKEAKDGGV
jgi:hypothetical protein